MRADELAEWEALAKEDSDERRWSDFAMGLVIDHVRELEREIVAYRIAKDNLELRLIEACSSPDSYFGDDCSLHSPAQVY